MFFWLFSILQRYKLKAIHNLVRFWVMFLFTVFNTSKIQIESYSQRTLLSSFNVLNCFQYFKDTNWKLFTTSSSSSPFFETLFSILQRYKLKAIHNHSNVFEMTCTTVFNTSKIQIESYSQLTWPKNNKGQNCFQYFKDTNWKLFTTHFCNTFKTVKLFSILQRYKLKAIHNCCTGL